MRNILITGATSFIGKHLVKRLLQLSYNVTALLRETSDPAILGESKKQIDLHYFDSTYQSIDHLFSHKKFDCVIHLAAFSSHEHKSEQVSNIIDSNIKLGTFILEAMEKNSCRNFINTSTYWQNYGNEEYQPTCLYAATKKAFEDIVSYYCMNGLTAISLKLYDVYGYDDHRSKLLNFLLRNRNSGQTFDLSEGNQKLYMVFIDDVINAYITAIDLLTATKGHQIYSIFGEEKYSLRKIIEIAQEVTKQKFMINWGRKPYYKFQIMDPMPENKLKNWQAKTSLAEGIKTILSKEND